MNEQAMELIQDLLSIYFTKKDVPDIFEVDTVEKAIELIGDYMDTGTKESYTYWVEKYKVE